MVCTVALVRQTVVHLVDAFANRGNEVKIGQERRGLDEFFVLACLFQMPRLVDRHLKYLLLGDLL